ncbi:dynein-associated protein [Plasmodium cynomolgi strain B]|uniref:Dynein-associated protein n=1 Tax=Plasmodium cynomolgi (strain B) TaxID=1120755 RepID=K6VGI2_PLACD|nr:dynein-associated protein [Plasmodium cynomolgi strain B]GAB68447.1 dynein-associated protein [Plasmodium cynomolgi strain B]
MSQIVYLDEEKTRGRYTYPNGNVYVGDFKNEKFHGKDIGTLAFKDKGEYRGTWENGKLVRGEYYYSDGLEYEERWKYLVDSPYFFNEEINKDEIILKEEKTNAFLGDVYDIGDGYCKVKESLVYSFADDKMIDYYHCYTKKRSEVGQPCGFTKSKSQVVGRIEPNKELQKKYMLKENIYYSDENVKKQSECYVNIESVKLLNKFFYHNEGGWTKDIDISDQQNKIKYVKRLDKDINTINSVKTLMNETTRIINKNNSIGIYKEYFQDEEQTEEEFKIKSMLVIKDKNRKYCRYVTSIKWSTDSTHKLAISYCVNNYKQILSDSPKNCLLYNLNEINNPYQILFSKTFIKCLRFNHKNSDLLLAGSYDGTVNLWDLRKKNTLCESSSNHASHKNIVQDVIWLQTKTNNHCLSVSNDGLCLLWDIRNFTEHIESFSLHKDSGEVCQLVETSNLDSSSLKNSHGGVDISQFLTHTERLPGTAASGGANQAFPPTGKGSGGGAAGAAVAGGAVAGGAVATAEVAAGLTAAGADSMGVAPPSGNLCYSANCLEWNLEAGPSKILVGTDEGYVLSLSKRQAKNMEMIQKYGASNEKHLSAITSIKRIPINLKYFLSTDKWGFNIWSEDIKFPIISNYYDESVINKGLWIRDSSFFILTRKDGYLDLWNLLYNYNEPIIQHKICNCSVTEIDAHLNNKYISVGNEQGDTHILKLGCTFCRNSSEEKNALDELFERESKREKNLEYIRKQLNCFRRKRECLNIQDVCISDDVVQETQREYESVL